MEPDGHFRQGGSTKKEHDDEIIISLDDDMKRYLQFLEMMRIVKNREEAIQGALKIFKKLNMHDWLPYIYRHGTERLIIITQSMVNDLFNSISDKRLYDTARTSALKKKALNPIDPRLDLTEVDNWDVILRELENYGWGKFTRDREELMVEYLGVPITYLRGFLESLFNVEFRVRQSKSGEIYILTKAKYVADHWR